MRQADTRFRAEVETFKDENTGASERPVQVARKNFRLLVESLTGQTYDAIMLFWGYSTPDNPEDLRANAAGRSSRSVMRPPAEPSGAGPESFGHHVGWDDRVYPRNGRRRVAVPVWARAAASGS